MNMYFQPDLFPDMLNKTYNQSHTNSMQIFPPNNRFYLDICENISFTSKWQMPRITGVSLSAPNGIIAFYRINKHTPSNIWPHFYTDDRRILPFLANPYQMANRLKPTNAVIGPDISIKPEMPLPMIIAISFYNKLLTAFMQKQGITVVENVIWCDESSYEPCFEGYATNSTIAVNSTGIGNDKRAAYLWDKGYETMIEALKPTLIIRYGAKRPCERTDISVYYENDNKIAARYGR